MPLYSQVILDVNPEEMHVVFNTINVTNFGRDMAYLTLVYLMHDSEDAIHVELFVWLLHLLRALTLIARFGSKKVFSIE